MEVIAVMLGIKKLLICGDDKIIIYHLLGYCKVPNKYFQALYDEAFVLLKNFAKVNFKLIPRYLNDEAEQLAREGLLNKSVRSGA